jgi:hypothetical protein
MTINIENLTNEQCEMLDIMWAFDTAEEYLSWFENLDAEDQEQAVVLQTLVILESMEEMLAEVTDQYADARAVLKKFML